MHDIYRFISFSFSFFFACMLTTSVEMKKQTMSFEFDYDRKHQAKNFLPNIYLQRLYVIDRIFIIHSFLFSFFFRCVIIVNIIGIDIIKNDCFFSQLFFLNTTYSYVVLLSSSSFFSLRFPIISHSHTDTHTLSLLLSVTPGGKRSQATRLHYRIEYDDRRHRECKRRGY